MSAKTSGKVTEKVISIVLLVLGVLGCIATAIGWFSMQNEHVLLFENRNVWPKGVWGMLFDMHRLVLVVLATVVAALAVWKEFRCRRGVSLLLNGILILAIVAFWFATIRIVFATLLDPTDRAGWHAAPLTQEQEERFHQAGSWCSPVWAELDRRGYFPDNEISQTNLDIELMRNCNAMNRSFTVRTAYGAKGLYLLFDVIDNDFGGYHHDQWYVNDCIDFFIDTLPAATIRKQAARVCGYGAPGLTRTSFQLQCCFRREGIDSVYINHFTDAASRESSGIIYRGYSVDECRDSTGVKVTSAGINPIQRYQQWFIPWSLLYGHGRTPQPGSNLAVSFAYNDIDLHSPTPEKASPYGRGGPYEAGVFAWFALHLDDTEDSPKVALFENSTSVMVDDVADIDESSNGVMLIEHAPFVSGIGPESQEQFRYGVLWIDGQPVAIAVSKIPDSLNPVLFNNDSLPSAYELWEPGPLLIDKNGNFDFRDDTPIVWRREDPSESSVRTGIRHNSFRTQVSFDSLPNKPSIDLLYSTQIRDMIFCRRLDARIGELTVGEKEVRCLLYASGAEGSIITYPSCLTLGVDLNGDGAFDFNYGSPEAVFDLYAPVDINGLQMKVDRIDAANNRLVLSDISFNQRSTTMLAPGVNCFSVSSPLPARVRKELHDGLKGNALLFVYFPKYGCGGGDRIEVDTAAELFGALREIENTVGPCGIVVLKQGRRTRRAQAVTGITVVTESEENSDGFFDTFRVRKTPDLIGIRSDGTIVYRGDNNAQEVVRAVLSSIDQ